RDLNQLQAAEKSFNDALRLNSRDPEALNGLGLIRVQRGKPKEAIEFFNAALKQQADYAPALLNLAIVAHQYSRQTEDHKLALQKYRQYIALKPAPEKVAAVKLVAQQLEAELTPPVHTLTNTPNQTSADSGSKIARANEVREP